MLSLAQECGSRAIGVILSGTGADGATGLEAVKASGGVTLAQDPATAKFGSMPRAAIQRGCVDLVLTPEAIAGELAKLGHHPYIAEDQALLIARKFSAKPLRNHPRTAAGCNRHRFYPLS